MQVVAWRRENRGYPTESALVRALIRRCPELDRDAASSLLARAFALYDAAVEVAGRHQTALYAARTGHHLNIPNRVREELRSRTPGHTDRDYDEALSWVFYVHHLR